MFSVALSLAQARGRIGRWSYWFISTSSQPRELSCVFLDHCEKLGVTAPECHWSALPTETPGASEGSAEAGGAER